MSRLLASGAQSILADLFSDAPDALIAWATSTPRRTSNLTLAVMRAQRAFRQAQKGQKVMHGEPDAVFYTTHGETGEEGDGVYTMEAFQAPAPPIEPDAPEVTWRKVGLMGDDPDRLLRWAQSYYRGSWQGKETWWWPKDPREESADVRARRAGYKREADALTAQRERLAVTPASVAREHRRDWFDRIPSEEWSRLITMRELAEKGEAVRARAAALEAELRKHARNGQRLVLYPRNAPSASMRSVTMAEIRAWQEEAKARPYLSEPSAMTGPVHVESFLYPYPNEQTNGALASFVALFRGSTKGRAVALDPAAWSGQLPPPAMLEPAGREQRWSDITRIRYVDLDGARYWMRGSWGRVDEAFRADGARIRKGSKAWKAIEEASYDAKSAGSLLTTKWSVKDAPKDTRDEDEMLAEEL